MKSIARQKEINKRLRALVPLASMEDFLAMENVALAGHLRHLPPSISAWQAVTTRARHAYTDYDALLEEGYDVESARHFVIDSINEKLSEWGCTERVSEEQPPEE
ncbi:MAG: DUF2293 domain-containing protein [Pseudomonadota bacterium]